MRRIVKKSVLPIRGRRHVAYLLPVFPSIRALALHSGHSCNGHNLCHFQKLRPDKVIEVEEPAAPEPEPELPLVARL